MSFENFGNIKQQQIYIKKFNFSFEYLIIACKELNNILTFNELLTPFSTIMLFFQILFVKLKDF